jgi:hypothetical protein
VVAHEPTLVSPLDGTTPSPAALAWTLPRLPSPVTLPTALPGPVGLRSTLPSEPDGGWGPSIVRPKGEPAAPDPRRAPVRASTPARGPGWASWDSLASSAARPGDALSASLVPTARPGTASALGGSLRVGTAADAQRRPGTAEVGGLSPYLTAYRARRGATGASAAPVTLVDGGSVGKRVRR